MPNLVKGSPDSPVIRLFLQRAREETFNKRGGELADQKISRILKDLSTVKGLFAVTYEDENLSLGTCLYSFKNSRLSHIPENYGVIHFLFVDPSHRRQGIGRSLVETVMNELIEKGINRLSVDVLPGDRAIKNLLESLNFRAEMLSMVSRI